MSEPVALPFWLPAILSVLAAWAAYDTDQSAAGRGEVLGA